MCDLAVPQRSPGLLLIPKMILAVLEMWEGGRQGGREGRAVRVGVGLGGVGVGTAPLGHCISVMNKDSSV